MDELEYLNDPTTPRWLRDIFRFLPVKSQFVLSGNVRDKFPFPVGSACSLRRLDSVCIRIIAFERL